MRFKIDENLPLESAKLLNCAGHDASTIHDQQMVGELDAQIASVCQSEQRALLTLDLDFADIRAYPPLNYHGIIVLRPRTQSKAAVIQLITQIIRLLTIERLEGNLWILQENGLRSFALSLGENGLLKATVRSSDGALQSVGGDASLPLTTWRHLVMTADGEQLQLYEDGQLLASTTCTTLAACDSETVWFGTDANGFGLWDGRIDELALFDRALSSEDIAALYQVARDEAAKSE